MPRIDVLPIAIGTLLILFNGQFTRSAVNGQRRAWGWSVSEKQTRVMAVVVGAVFVLSGVLIP